MAQNTEILIETVKKFPILYDTSHPEYKNTRTKNKIWDNIAEIIGESDGDTIKNKWKNLRDAYSKHLRSNKTHTGQAAKNVERYKTWPWVEQMSFLRPYLQFASTQSNIQNHPEEAGSTSQQADLCSIETPTSSQHLHSRRKRAANQNESQVDKVINFLNNRQSEYDDTDLIFLGYSKTIKKLSKRRQAIVKFKIAKIIMEAELEQSEESSSTVDSGLLLSSHSQSNVFGVSTPMSSSNEDTNTSQDFIVTSSPPFTQASANMMNVITSHVGFSNNRSITSDNTDLQVPGTSRNFHAITDSQQDNNLSRPFQFFIPSTDSENLSQVTYTQQQEPSVVEPKQYTIQSTDNQIKLYYERFGKKS